MTSTPSNQKSLGKAIRWTARLTGVLSIGVLLLFFIGEGFNPTKLTIKEWILFLFFPFGVMLGLLVGWKREFVGGLIAIISLALFCALTRNRRGGLLIPKTSNILSISLPLTPVPISWSTVGDIST